MGELGTALGAPSAIGEFVAGEGSAAGVLTADIYVSMIMDVLYTSLFSPYWIKLYYRKFGNYIDG